MNAAMGEKYVSELLQLFEKQGTGLYNGQHSLCLTMPCVYYIQRRLAAMEEGSPAPTPSGFAKLQQLQDCIGKILALKLIAEKRFPLPPSASLSLAPFKSLQILVLKKVPIQVVTGLQRVRGQLRTLVVQRCHVENLDDVIVRCGGDDSTSFAWSTLRELDLSHNSISELGDSLHYLPSLELMNISNNVVDGSTDGIECVDSVTHLHLGFNQLSKIPKFGSRAKYNLTSLNLRNNCLDGVEGIQELDSLVELDLTDNLLSRHVSLKPLQNLHHLATLSLVGNPLAFHHRHRLKTAEHLSNLVNPSEFRLDGKKLSSAERKCISRSLTHYTPRPPTLLPSPTSTSSSSPPNPPALIRSDVRDMVSKGRASPRSRHTQVPHNSVPTASTEESASSKKRRKKARTVALHDSDEEKMANASDSASSSVPLVHEQRLQDLKHLKKQLQDKWLLSTGSFDTSSNTDSSTAMARSASQPPGNRHLRPPSSSSSSTTSPLPLTVGAGVEPGQPRPRRRSQSDRLVVSVPVREQPDVAVESKQSVGSPLSLGEVRDDCFLVERYESDMEGEEEVECLLLTLSDRFLEERNINGQTVDQLDLHCLMAASVDSRAWRVRGEPSNRSEVLVLQFNTERRDRRKREYVLTESGDHQKFLDYLHPLVERNLATFSVASKVECLRCQRRFDSSQAVEQPSDEPQPLSSSSFSGKDSFRGRRPSLSRRMCPFCQSQVLQYVTPKVGSLGSGVVPSSAGLPPVTTASEQPCTVVQVAEKGNTRSGFIVEADPKVRVREEEEGWGDRQSFHSFPLDSASLEVHVSSDQGGHTSQYDKFTATSFHGNSSGSHGNSYPSSSDAMNTSWNYDSQSLGSTKRGSLPNQFSRNSTDVLYHAEDYQRSIDGKKHDPRTRLTSSEPTAGQQSAFGSARLTQRDFGSVPHRNMQRRHSSGDQMGPWRKPRGSLNPFDPNYDAQLVTASSSQAFSRSGLDLIQEQEGGASTDMWEEQVGGTTTDTWDERKSSVSSKEMSTSRSSGASGLEDRFPGNPYREKDSRRSPQGGRRALRVRDSGHPVSKPKTVPTRPTERGEPSGSVPGSYNPTVDDVCFDLPLAQASTSVPEQSSMGRGKVGQDKKKDSHSRSRSVDYHHSKYTKVSQVTRTAPQKEDPSPQSTSARSSQGSLSSKGSLRGSRGEGSQVSLGEGSPKLRRREGSQGYSLGELQSRVHTHSPSSQGTRHHNSRDSSGSSERIAQPFSSGERRNSSGERKGYSSGERKGYSSGERKGYSSGERKGYSSGERKGYSSGERKGYSSGERKSHSSEEKEKRSSSGSDRGRGASRGSLKRSSGEEKGRRQTSRENGIRQGSGSLKSSSESAAGGGRPAFTASVLVKDDDPCYIHHSMNLNLDMEVFNTDSGEEFKMVFRSPVVQYSKAGEMTTLVIVSNLNMFVYRIVAPESPIPSKWLQLIAKHPLEKLVYIDIGAGYQFLRVEFDLPDACYTFLLRDEHKCQLCSTKLAYVVSDAPSSNFRTVGVCSFSLDFIRHPGRILREAVLKQYDRLGGSRLSPPPSADEDKVSLYLLAHRHLAGNKERVAVTLVITDKSLLMAQENFQQWPLSRLQPLPRRETLKPPFSGTVEKEITDIEEIILDRDQSCHIAIRFFKESVSEGESRSWKLIAQTVDAVQHLVSCVQKPWEAMFETSMPISYK